MRLRWWYALVLLWVLAGLSVWWWGWDGGRHWLAIQTGTDYCVNLPAAYRVVCQRYGYWSGFGSVFPWVLLGALAALTGMVLHWRYVNCHEPGCWRVRHHPDATGTYWYCVRHHPDHAEFGGKLPPREHRHRLHRAAQARRELNCLQPAATVVR